MMEDDHGAQPAPAAYTTPPRLLNLAVAVVMEREARPNQWEDWRFRLAGVWLDDGRFGSGSEPHLLHDDGRCSQWAFAGLKLELSPDEAEGYQLNLTSGQPVWFVMWRIDDEDPSRAAPQRVTLSYLEAGRWLDAQERVDNLPLPDELVELLRTYTEVHYRPEPKRRQRPASFLPPERRGGER